MQYRRSEEIAVRGIKKQINRVYNVRGIFIGNKTNYNEMDLLMHNVNGKREGKENK